jgi:hypothetical protein
MTALVTKPRPGIVPSSDECDAVGKGFQDSPFTTSAFECGLYVWNVTDWWQGGSESDIRRTTLGVVSSRIPAEEY